MTADRHGPRSSPRRRRPGLALAGGGPVGAMYELGALRALEEAVDGLDLTQAGSYVGVSAGSFIAACLANGISTKQMLRAVLRRHAAGRGRGDVDPLRPELFFTPAYLELARRSLKLPRLVLEALLQSIRAPRHEALGRSIELLLQALPVGLFDNEPIRRFLEVTFSLRGHTDDFRKLARKLTVVVADIDTGTAIRLGQPPWDHVPISRAVQASTAVPGVYPPVIIDGRSCVDGVLLKTVHASVALEQGVQLLFCVNPLVPVDVSAAVKSGRLPEHALTVLGLPAVLSQTLRTLIHSRLEIGLSRYAARFPEADIVLLEPDAGEYELFFANIFSFRERGMVCERGYSATRRTLLARYDELALVVGTHGFRLRPEVLADETKSVWTSCDLEQPRSRGVRPTREPEALQALDRALTRLEAQVRAGDGQEAGAPPASR